MSLPVTESAAKSGREPKSDLSHDTKVKATSSQLSNSAVVQSQGGIRQLKDNSSVVRAIEEGGAGSGGDFEIVPIDPRMEVLGVRILNPISLEELAGELYGARSSWQTLLIPNNRWALMGMEGTSRLGAGTTLSIIPELLVEPVRSSVAKLQQRARQAMDSDPDALPYITAMPQGTLVVNNSGKYAVEWPNHWFMGKYADTIIEWWYESDPEARRVLFIPVRVFGPTGLIDRAREWEAPFGAPGAYTVHCRLTVPGGEQHHLRYTQVVVGLAEQTAIKSALFRDRRTSMARLSAERAAYDRDFGAIPSEESEKYMDRIRALEAVSERATFVGVGAVYVSSSEQAASFPLQILIGPDPDRSEAIDRDFHLKLWDLTPGGKW